MVAGIIQATDLAGYRNRPVYIRKSMHTPPNYEAVRDLLIPTFFELLRNEESPAVRVVILGSSFPLKNGMNIMNTIELASVDQDIIPFTKFLASLTK